MEKRQFEVLALDSDSEDSEDEIQVLSETIANYGNIVTPLEVTPEIHEKINRSLGNHVPFQRKIKVIEAYSRKKNDNSIGTVSLSIPSTNGQGAKVINLGPASTFFPSPIQDVTNNNSRNKKRALQVATVSEKVVPEKCFPHSLPTNNAEVQTARSFSSVSIDSPVRKIKVKRFGEKQRGIPRKTNPPVGASPPDLTPPLYQNISQSFDDKIVDKDNSKYKSNTAKNVEVIRQSSSVKDQTSTSEILRNLSQYPEIENKRPSPTSPPTEACIRTLSQLEAGEFLALVGLCQVDAVSQTRKKVNGPTRLLRKRPKK